jgi:hypothetical protein
MNGHFDGHLRPFTTIWAKLRQMPSETDAPVLAKPVSCKRGLTIWAYAVLAHVQMAAKVL